MNTTTHFKDIETTCETHTRYLVGHRDTNEFWSRGEYKNKDTAFEQLELLRKFHPNTQWQMVRQQTINTVIMESIVGKV